MERICPIMSRPLQGPNAAFASKEEMIIANWYPVNGAPWENVFPCQRDNCMAWSSDGKCMMIEK